MRRLVGAIAVLAFSAAVFAGGPAREVNTRRVESGSALPADLTSPEGKSRWHVETLSLGAVTSASIVREASGPALELRGNAKSSKWLLSGADAERWLLPDRDPSQMKMGARVELTFSETKDGLADRVIAHVATVGIGWIHLPSGPKEVVLQRVLLLRQRAGEGAMSPDVLIHRWVSTLEGVVAEVSGPASSDGTKRLSVDRVDVLDSIVAGAADLKIYTDQIYRATFTDIKYGYDRGVGTTVQSLVPNPGINNVCDLLNLTTWNFLRVNSGTETASTQVTSIPSESCNTGRCGYQGYPPSGTLDPPILERLDRLTGSLRRDNQVVQWEDRATDRTLWLRAGAQNENVSGAFGSGETRFCFTDEVGKNRNEVPLWQMTHSDANGFYAQLGDSWGSTPVPTGGCQESFFTLVCGASQPFTPNPNYGQACTSSGQTHNGQQTGKLVKAGVVITPSGHTLNSLVVRNTTDFCIYSGSSCGFVLDRVRTIVYYWQVPYLGSVALIRGPRKVDYAAGEVGETPCTNFTTLDFTDMAYGLFPPVSITAGAVTDTTLSLSWNPGNDVHRINGYKIYWDTDPGSSTNYAFNSVANAGQVSIVGTTATISGLTPGTPYYVTVTSLSNFTDPSSTVVTPYESIRYPTTVLGRSVVLLPRGSHRDNHRRDVHPDPASHRADGEQGGRERARVLDGYFGRLRSRLRRAREQQRLQRRRLVRRRPGRLDDLLGRRSGSYLSPGARTRNGRQRSLGPLQPLSFLHVTPLFRVLTTTLFVCVAALTAVAVRAQSTSAALAGRIASRDGSPVAGAMVQARSEDSGATRAATSGPDGRYRFDLLAPGAWTVVARGPEGELSDSKTVVLRLQQTGQVDLVIGTGLEEEVTVRADVPLVDSQRTGGELRVLGSQAENLPIGNENATDLALLDSSVRQAAPASYYGERGSPFVINGQTGRANSYLVDGLDNNDQASGTSLNAEFSNLVISEFLLLTHQFAPEFGRASGGVLNIITERGTNQFEGLGFVQGAPRAFSSGGDLVNALPATEGVPAESSKWSAGMRWGGPFKKDKAFWFAAYEHQEQNAIIPYTARRPTGFPAAASKRRVRTTTSSSAATSTSMPRTR
jgi:hypothetical protein